MEKGISVRKCCYICAYLVDVPDSDEIYCKIYRHKIISPVGEGHECDAFKLWEQLELED